ncbi:hypothetical protein HII17_16815 [Thalassotalea sp. M1531]|uniref:Uncharacterized protein n=1 Tax=Thalassotalea algicola TaxID=2716224 RepID=A0A7Y0LFD6_9GAMM|nr:hypothetical protein [Thalassotalea algicola]NMP33217.1 hypothetical protein [Thalassotalea algicola]
MTKLLTTLEKIAQDASLQSAEALAAFVEQADLSEQEKAIILKQDSDAIAAKLDVKKDIVCFIVPAEDDEPAKESDEEEKDKSEESKLVSNG